MNQSSEIEYDLVHSWKLSNIIYKLFILHKIEPTKSTEQWKDIMSSFVTPEIN